MSIFELPKQLYPDFAVAGEQPKQAVTIDYSNPLAKGAALLVGADGYDHVNKVLGDFVNGAQRSVNIHGRSAFLDNDASSNTSTPEAIDFPDFIFNETQFSITFIAQWTGPSASFNRLLSAKDSFTDTKGFECQTSSDNSKFVMTGASSKFWQPTIETNWAFGGDVFILTAQWDGTSSKVYLNGALAASQTSTAIDNAGTTSGGIRVGGVLVGSDRAFEGHMNYVYIRKGVLTDAEATELHRDPYQILKPKTPQVYFTAGAGGGAFTLTADSGAYAYSGTENSLLLSALLGADSGSYAYSGDVVALNTGFNLPTDSGSYAYSGTEAALTKDSVVVTDTGAYVYSGAETTLAKGSAVTADSGSYAYSGTETALTFASAGSFTLSADSGSYAYSGTEATLAAGLKLTTASGSYTYSGTEVNLATGFSLSLDSGSYSYTGAALVFSKTSALAAESGSYAYSGSTVALTVSGQIVIGVTMHIDIEDKTMILNSVNRNMVI